MITSHVVRAAAVLGVLVLQALSAQAAITLQTGSINMFRDTRGANNVGISQGDVFQYGANVVGGSTGTTVGAGYAPTGFVDAQAPCQPLAANPNFCANSTAFNVNRVAQPWSLRFERPGEMPVISVVLR